MTGWREAMDREADLLLEMFNQGKITREEYNKEMRELQRDYKAAAEEAARDAYERELERW